MDLLLLHAETNIIIPRNIPSFEASNNFIVTNHYHSKETKYTFLLQKLFCISVFLTPHNQLFQVLQMKRDLSCLAPTSSCMFLSGLN